MKGEKLPDKMLGIYLFVCLFAGKPGMKHVSLCLSYSGNKLLSHMPSLYFKIPSLFKRCCSRNVLVFFFQRFPWALQVFLAEKEDELAFE